MTRSARMPMRREEFRVEPRFARRHDQPDFLCIRFGRLRRRLVLVQVEQVTEIDPA